MVLHETEQQLQSVLDGTVLAACRQTLALLYQTELAVEGSINVILDKSETIHVKINNCEVKSKEDLDEKKIEKIKVTSPPKRRRGRPPKSQSKTKVNLIEEKVKKTEPLPSCSNEEIGEAAVSDRGTPVKKEPSEKAAIPQAAKSDPQSFKDMVVNSSLSELQHLATQLAHHVPPDDVQDTDADDRKKDEGASNISESWQMPGWDLPLANSESTDLMPPIIPRRRRKMAKTRIQHIAENDDDAQDETQEDLPKTPKKKYRKKERKMFKCDICDREFSWISQLNIHQRYHTGITPYKCQYCGKGFAESGGVKIHERMHTGEKPFKCSVCDFTAARKHSVELHERVHTGEKPYQCCMCGMAFSCKSHVLRHERTHTGEKRYACKYCGKRYQRRPDMLSHERTHTGEKPFMCEFCAKGFADKRTLENHIKVHSSETYKTSSEQRKIPQSFKHDILPPPPQALLPFRSDPTPDFAENRKIVEAIVEGFACQRNLENHVKVPTAGDEENEISRPDTVTPPRTVPIVIGPGQEYSGQRGTDSLNKGLQPEDVYRSDKRKIVEAIVEGFTSQRNIDNHMKGAGGDSERAAPEAGTPPKTLPIVIDPVQEYNSQRGVDTLGRMQSLPPEETYRWPPVFMPSHFMPPPQFSHEHQEHIPYNKNLNT